MHIVMPRARQPSLKQQREHLDLRKERLPLVVLTSQSLRLMTSSRSAQKLSRKIVLWITEISASAALTLFEQEQRNERWKFAITQNCAVVSQNLFRPPINARF